MGESSTLTTHTTTKRNGGRWKTKQQQQQQQRRRRGGTGNNGCILTVVPLLLAVLLLTATSSSRRAAVVVDAFHQSHLSSSSSSSLTAAAAAALQRASWLNIGKNRQQNPIISKYYSSQSPLPLHLTATRPHLSSSSSSSSSFSSSSSHLQQLIPSRSSSSSSSRSRRTITKTAAAAAAAAATPTALFSRRSSTFSQQGRAEEGHEGGGSSSLRRRLQLQLLPKALLRFIIRAIRTVVRPVTNMKKKVKRAAVLLVAPLVFAFGFMGEGPQAAHAAAAAASAPVMALPKAEGRDPASEALLEHERQMVTEAQQELTDMASKAREIERTQGEKARVKFEKQFKQEQQRRAEEKVKGLEELKRNLLDQGIDPFRDLEGTRQITFYEKGVDLGDVPGTPFYLEKDYETRNKGRNYKKSMAYQKRYNRQIIACMVEDLKNRDIDPLEYFEQRQDQTSKILSMPMAQAQQMAVQYRANLDKYGQITPPKPGELSALEIMKQKADSPEARKAAKAKEREEAKRLKAESKAKAAAEKARMKAEKKAAKEAEKASKKAAAAAKKKASAAATAAGAASASLQQEQPEADVVDDGLSGEVADALEGGTEDDGGGVAVTGDAPSSSSVVKGSKKLPIVPVSTFLVAAGGGGYALKLYKDKSAREEEERQQRLKLLLGEDEEKTKTTNGDGAVDGDPSGALLLDDQQADVKKEPPTTPTSPVADKQEPLPPAPSVSPPKPKKKGRLGGLGSVFSRKKNDRETDLTVLVSSSSPDARAPEFASMLAKILTFGAPGRFPDVQALPGGMPMTEFDLDQAKQMLIDARSTAGLELSESAEIFANVVNCMLIDIVDLASSSIKEGEDKVTIDAINIVVDFMQHAASLYDAVAEGIEISPVTYGGDLGKSKLEKMFAAYSGSAMTDMENMKDDFDARVGLLQDVFQISDKKAEGLMMKAMQKQMIEMLKSGEGMEGMQEMMGGMGGAGMPGMDALMGGAAGGGEEPSPEQVKEMLMGLKEMKDSGSFSKDELDTIKKEFKNSFGSSIDDLTKDGQDLDETEQELLDLMKSILD